MSKADPKVLAWLKSRPEPDLTDPDNPEWTKADFAKASQPGDPGFPEEIHDAFAKTRRPGQRGPQKAPTKRSITLRLDLEVVDHFKAGGPGWQSRINATLAEVVKKRA